MVMESRFPSPPRSASDDEVGAYLGHPGPEAGSFAKPAHAACIFALSAWLAALVWGSPKTKLISLPCDAGPLGSEALNM